MTTIQTSHIQVDATAGIGALPELAEVIANFAESEDSGNKFIQHIVSATILLPGGKEVTESFPSSVAAHEIVERFTSEFAVAVDTDVVEQTEPELSTEDSHEPSVAADESGTDHSHSSE